MVSILAFLCGSSLGNLLSSILVGFLKFEADLNYNIEERVEKKNTLLLYFLSNGKTLQLYLIIYFDSFLRLERKF